MTCGKYFTWTVGAVDYSQNKKTVTCGKLMFDSLGIWVSNKFSKTSTKSGQMLFLIFV